MMMISVITVSLLSHHCDERSCRPCVAPAWHCTASTTHCNTLRHADSIADIFQGFNIILIHGFFVAMPSSHLSSITLDVLSSLFVYSEKEAAKVLGICLTTLKKASRKHGIERWPYRKIKSSQLRESRSLKRSASSSISKPLRNSMSPSIGSSDNDSESSSQVSSNTAKLARSSFITQHQAPAGEMIFSSHAIPTSMYSFDEVDDGHNHSSMWMNTVEESSWKKVQQQQQYQYQLQEQVHQRHDEPHNRYQSSQIVNGRVLPQSGHFEPAAHNLEYSDVPVLYSRPIDSMSYMC
jgi:hypothetical protein